MVKVNRVHLLEEIKSEYDLCINNPYEYQKKVDSISDLFSLKGKQRLKGDNCPVYVIGKYEGNDCWEGTISVRIERKRNNEDAKDV